MGQKDRGGADRRYADASEQARGAPPQDGARQPGPFDREYQLWREDQLRRCDEDYDAFCREWAAAERAAEGGGQTLADRAAAGHDQMIAEELAAEALETETSASRFDRLFNDWRRERYVGQNKIGSAPLLFGGQNTLNSIYADD